MTAFSLEQLTAFIVQAKAATYVGGRAPGTSGRPASHDLQFRDGNFAYLDSYFGGADFIGQEVVYYADRPVWALNYYGRILEPARISPAETGQAIQASLFQMYQQGRFLGGFEHVTPWGTYVDTSHGDVTSFTGQEWIMREGVRVYELVYHGGLIKE
jgi:hypothetical protein